MELHQRGVDLLVNVMDAADNAEQLTHDEIRRLLTEVTEVMCLMLERDAEIALRGKMIDDEMAEAFEHQIAENLVNQRSAPQGLNRPGGGVRPVDK